MQLSKQWLIKHFVRHANAARPLLLLLDGHSFHYNLEAVTFAKENGIVMFTLVPHMTHKTQPLDTVVYGLLKSNWQSVCQDYIQYHPGSVIMKYKFSKLFSKAWLSTLEILQTLQGLSF